MASRKRSGLHRNPTIRFVATPAEIDLYDRATEHSDADDRSEWARNVLAVAAADELGLDPAATLRGLGRDG